MKIVHYGDVDAKRATEYPPLQRQIEMLCAALRELRHGPFSPQVEQVIAQIERVQQKYPDPQPEEPHEKV